MFIAVSLNFTFCDFDLSQITLECGLNSPKITFFCEWMCEKCRRLSSDIQVMYEHSTFLLFDVHLHAGEGRLSELAMVWGCTLAILYVTYNSYSKQHHKYLFSSLLIPINLSYFEIDELYQWKNMLWQNCNYSSSATQNTINFCIIAVTIIIYIYLHYITENRNIDCLAIHMPYYQAFQKLQQVISTTAMSEWNTTFLLWTKSYILDYNLVMVVLNKN